MNKAILLALCLASNIAIANPAPEQATWEYTVKAGDTLWSVASKHLTSLAHIPQLKKSNRVSNSYRLPLGSILRIPYRWIRQSVSEAKLDLASGQVSAMDAAGNPLPLTPGRSYPAGTRFSTGDDSLLRLKFPDGSALSLNANTTLILQTQIHFPSTGAILSQNKLENGSTGSEVSPNKLMPSRYEIRTPSATTTVRGTDFRVNIASGDDTTAEVLHGKINVRGQQSAVDVPAGFGSRTGGKNAGKPVRLPDPPKLDGIPTEFIYNPPLLSWPQQSQASAYRAMISQLDGAEQRLQERLITQTSFLPVLPANGEYQLSVRSRDADELEGPDAKHTFRLRALPAPPLLVTRTGWQSSRLVALQTGANRLYPARIQLSRDPDFSSLLLDVIVTENIYRTKLPANGIWYWRAARLDSKDQAGPYSDRQQLEIKPGWPLLSADTLLTGRRYPLANARYTLSLIPHGTPEPVPIVLPEQDTPQWSTKQLPRGHFIAAVTIRDDKGYQAEERQPSLILP